MPSPLVIAVLVESELEADRRTVVQVDGVSVSVASGQVAGGQNELPARGTCAIQKRAAHESEWATLRSRCIGRNTVDRRKCEVGDHGAGDGYSLGVAYPELHGNRRRSCFGELSAAGRGDRSQNLVARTVGARSHRSVGHSFYSRVDKADRVIG